MWRLFHKAKLSPFVSLCMLCLFSAGAAGEIYYVNDFETGISHTARMDFTWALLMGDRGRYRSSLATWHAVDVIA